MKHRCFIRLSVLIVLMLVGCQNRPTPTAVSLNGTPSIVAIETKTPVLRPPTAVSEPIVVPSLTRALPTATETPTPWPTATPSLTNTPRPTSFSPADLQATVLARFPNPYTSLAVKGNLALIGIGTRLAMVDITNPAQPEFIGELELPNRIKKLQVAGNTAYLVLEIPNPVDTMITFHTVDITDPAHPILLDSYIPEYLAIDAVVIGDIAYIIGLHYRMEGIDVSDPANIHLAKTIRQNEEFYCFPAGTNFFSVDEEMGYLHLLQGSCRSGGRFLEVMDVSNPLYPVVIGRINYFPGYGSMSVVYHDNYAFTLIQYFVRVFDYSNWMRPALLTDLVFPDSGVYRTNGKMIIVDGRVYLSSSAGLDIFEQTERFQTTLLNSLYPAIYISNITAENGYVYLLAWEEGLLILNTADPANPVEIGRWNE